MNYHLIKKDDMLNGEGLRVTVFLSGCNHRCYNCQNPETWDIHSGKLFDENSKQELFEQLAKSHISGVTFSGGDPLHYHNLQDLHKLILEIKEKFKVNIWIYTGYTWEEIMFPITFGCMNGNNDWIFTRQKIISECDVLVDGEYNHSLKDDNYPWAGSTNQRVIDIQKSIKEKSIVLYE